MVKTCFAVGCNVQYSTKTKVSFYRIPIDRPGTGQLWLNACGRPNATPGPGAGICYRHFNEEDFVKARPGVTRRLLLRDAVPSKFGDDADPIRQGRARPIPVQKPRPGNSVLIQRPKVVVKEDPPKKCAFPHCPGNATFLFPRKDRALLSFWVQALNKFWPKDQMWMLTEQSAICNRHFTKDSFVDEETQRHLFQGAVPSIFLKGAPVAAAGKKRSMPGLIHQGGGAAKQIKEEAIDVEGPYLEENSFASEWQPRIDSVRGGEQEGAQSGSEADFVVSAHALKEEPEDEEELEEDELLEEEEDEDGFLEEVGEQEECLDPVSEEEDLSPVSPKVKEENLNPVSENEECLDPVSEQVECLDPVSEQEECLDPVSEDEECLDPVSDQEECLDPVSDQEECLDPVSENEECLDPVSEDEDLSPVSPKEDLSPVDPLNTKTITTPKKVIQLKPGMKLFTISKAALGKMGQPGVTSQIPRIITPLVKTMAVPKKKKGGYASLEAFLQRNPPRAVTGDEILHLKDDPIPKPKAKFIAPKPRPRSQRSKVCHLTNGKARVQYADHLKEEMFSNDMVESFPDVEIRSTDGNFGTSLNRAVLATASPLLHELFLDLPPGTEAPDMIICEMESSNLKSMVDFMTTGVLNFKTTNKRQDNSIMNMCKTFRIDLGEFDMQRHYPTPKFDLPAPPGHRKCLWCYNIVPNDEYLNHISSPSCYRVDTDGVPHYRRSEEITMLKQTAIEKVILKEREEEKDIFSPITPKSDFVDFVPVANQVQNPSFDFGGAAVSNSLLKPQRLKPKILKNEEYDQTIEVKEGPSVCDYCNKKFGNEKILDRHHRLFCQHAPTTFRCPNCKKNFSSASKLNLHRKCHHRNICGVCSKEFSNEARLTFHMRTHDESLGTQCNLCGLQLASKATLKNHKKQVHASDSDKEFQCEWCNKKFGVKSRYTEHLNIHTNAKPHGCPICPAHFNFHANVRSHMISKHPGEYEARRRQREEGNGSLQKKLEEKYDEDESEDVDVSDYLYLDYETIQDDE